MMELVEALEVEALEVEALEVEALGLVARNSSLLCCRKFRSNPSVSYTIPILI
jgi:hypothetical protein